MATSVHSSMHGCPRWMIASTLVLLATACGGSGDVAPEELEPLAVQKRSFEIVDRPLAWLAARQQADGSWSADDAPAGSPADDVSATSLALFAFYARTYTNRSDGPYGRVVTRALQWLRNAQAEDGRFRPVDGPGSPRHDALATSAWIEVYGLTGSVIYRDPARRAVDALVASGAATPPAAGVTNEFALDAFGWAVGAISTARKIAQVEVQNGKEATFQVDDRTLGPARAWLDSASVVALDDLPTVATRIQVRCAIGNGREDREALRRDVLLVSAIPAPRDSAMDLSGRTAAIARMGSTLTGYKVRAVWFPRGELWLAAADRRDADAKELRGSYEARGPFKSRTGRVEATAYGVMVEPPYCTSYLPQFPGTEPDPEPESGPQPTDAPPAADPSPEESK